MFKMNIVYSKDLQKSGIFLHQQALASEMSEKEVYTGEKVQS